MLLSDVLPTGAFSLIMISDFVNPETVDAVDPVE